MSKSILGHFFTKKEPMNSQEFPAIRIRDKNNLSTRTHHLNIILKFEVISFEPEKMEMESGARFLAFSIYSLYIGFAFSVCLCVGVHFFLSKISQELLDLGF